MSYTSFHGLVCSMRYAVLVKVEVGLVCCYSWYWVTDTTFTIVHYLQSYCRLGRTQQRTFWELLSQLYKFSCSSQLSFHDLITSCSEDLFDNAHKSNHCLHELLSSYVHRLESLRPWGHDLMLPTCTSYLHKRSFFVRTLFEFV